MSKQIRCGWCGDDPLYMAYHDLEWGVPVKEDQKMFEFLLLESFQAGLSWITVLRKRESFREAFDNMDFNKIALYDDKKIEELLNNPSIIRNRAKIEAAVNNAQIVRELVSKGNSISDFLWDYVKHTPVINQWKSLEEIPAKTGLSEKISKDMKKLGFKFLGPRTIYAHMQACGMVNDHVLDCFRQKELVTQ